MAKIIASQGNGIFVVGLSLEKGIFSFMINHVEEDESIVETALLRYKVIFNSESDVVQDLNFITMTPNHPITEIVFDFQDVSRKPVVEQIPGDHIMNGVYRIVKENEIDFREVSRFVVRPIMLSGKSGSEDDPIYTYPIDGLHKHSELPETSSEKRDPSVFGYPSVMNIFENGVEQMYIENSIFRRKIIEMYHGSDSH